MHKEFSQFKFYFQVEKNNWRVFITSFFCLYTMFGRRVFGSGAIPQTMYQKLHIVSARQANRMVPSLVPITSLFASGATHVQPLCTTGALMSSSDGAQVLESILPPTFMANILGLSSAQLLNIFAPHPLLLRMVSDMTMILTYSVKLPLP